MNRRRLTHAIIKVLGYLSMKIGQGIFLCKKRKIYRVDELEHIVINRSDRIGDASLTKPLIDLLIHYLKNQGYKGSFTILASELNKSIFIGIEGAIEVVDERLKIESSNILEITRYKLYQGIICLYMRLKHRTLASKTLFIDLVGWWDMSILMHYFSKGYTSMISCNLCFGSVLLSNRITTPFTTFQGKRNLVETYIDLIERTFDQHGQFRGYVYEHIDSFYSDYMEVSDEAKSGVLVFVGCKADRNFTVSKWREIIEHLPRIFPGKIMVMDDNLNIYYKQLLTFSLPDRVELKENTFSLHEFKSFARGFQWIIGLDGGGMNYIRNVANNITIYTLADCHIRSAFVGDTQYHLTYVSKERFVGKAILPLATKTLQTIYIAKRSHGSYEDMPIAVLDDHIFREKV